MSYLQMGGFKMGIPQGIKNMKICKSYQAMIKTKNLARPVVSKSIKWPFRPAKKVQNTMPKSKISKNKNKIDYKSIGNPIQTLETFSRFEIIRKYIIVN